MQKERRREDIIQTAREIFYEKQYEAVKMAEVAQRAGIAKGTVFLYFKTKEELFLEIVRKDYECLFLEINEYLDGSTEKLIGSDAIHAFTGFITNALRSRGTFLRLLSILHTVLEKNISLEDILGFKRVLYDNILITGEKLEQSLTFLQKGGGTMVLMTMHAFLVGFQNLAQCPNEVHEAIKSAGMGILLNSFETGFQQALDMYLRGILLSNARGESI